VWKLAVVPLVPEPSSEFEIVIEKFENAQTARNWSIIVQLVQGGSKMLRPDIQKCINLLRPRRKQQRNYS
jgi:hypothetical protein